MAVVHSTLAWNYLRQYFSLSVEQLYLSRIRTDPVALLENFIEESLVGFIGKEIRAGDCRYELDTFHVPILGLLPKYDPHVRIHVCAA